MSSPYIQPVASAIYRPGGLHGDQTPGPWLTQALDQITAEVLGVLNDTNEDKAMVLAALGLAAGATYLLFYTDTPQALAAGAGTAVAGIAEGAGTAIAGLVPNVGVLPA